MATYSIGEKVILRTATPEAWRASYMTESSGTTLGGTEATVLELPFGEDLRYRLLTAKGSWWISPNLFDRKIVVEETQEQVNLTINGLTSDDAWKLVTFLKSLGRKLDVKISL